MTIITPNTLFIGKNYIFLENCHSTNSYLLDELSSKNIAEGTLICANHQYNGRGQKGNSWLSEPNVNLTFSILLMPKWLKPILQFYLTKLISISLIEVLNQYKDGFTIKWPNDIYFNDNKIAGVLIENNILNNQIKSSIVGVGINVNQQYFNLDNASSLCNIIDKRVDKDELLINFCEQLEANYFKFKKDIKSFDRLYLNFLYRRGEEHYFKVNNTKFLAEIIGVTELGELMLKFENELKTFKMKEVSFLF